MEHLELFITPDLLLQPLMTVVFCVLEQHQDSSAISSANIICLKVLLLYHLHAEMKTMQSGLNWNIAVPTPFDGYFSCLAHKGAYSGIVAPLKAEGGLSGMIQPKPPFNQDAWMSHHYPCADEMNLTPGTH
ncbi:hypothetical protein EV401DRAFT_1886118 [Pisolithus croceorrhizus]|nr:hypothetical protein EV401DRAFT_1886118 [Pisolithus croceorrhizus]